MYEISKLINFIIYLTSIVWPPFHFFLINLFMGVISGIVASMLVVRYLQKIKPEIIISPEIFKQKLEDKEKYGITVINKGDSIIYDLEISCWWVEYTYVEGKREPDYKRMEIGNKHINKRPFLDPKKDSNKGQIIFVFEDLENYWKDGSDFQIVATAIHSKSQNKAIVSYVFTKLDIYEKEFYADVNTALA